MEPVHPKDLQQYGVVTMYVKDETRTIVHIYVSTDGNPFPTRAKAKTLQKHLMTEVAEEVLPSEMWRFKTYVTKILPSLR